MRALSWVVHLFGRMVLFLLPVALADGLRLALLVATDHDAFKPYMIDHAKIADVSVDLLLASFTILIGLYFYAASPKGLVKPGGQIIRPKDLLAGAVLHFVILVSMLVSVLVASQFFADPTWARIWIPDLCGGLALLWSIVVLT